MRILFLIILNLIFINSFSQANNNYAVVEYKLYNNTDSPNVLNAELYINNTTTIYLAKYTTQTFNNAKEEKSRVNRVTVDTDYLKIDHKKKEIRFIDLLGSDNVLVTDNYPEFKWKITEETKVIGQYQCIKATASYRGRDWEAWFAPEVPLRYGPWKFHGLPGLIMEVYDSANRYTWRADKIEFRKDAVFAKDFDTLVKVKNKTAMSKRQFIKSQDEYDANLEKEMRQLMPDMGEVVNVRTGYELKYEWENK